MTRLAAILLLLLMPAVAGAQGFAMVWAGWPADPDLPQNVPTGALPANWNATADHTPANNAALIELLDGDTTGDATNGTANDWTIIELTAGQDYEGGIRIDDSCKYILIRSSGYASLPSFSLDDSASRIVSADETNMATISRAPTGAAEYVVEINGGDGAVGAEHIRFLGIKFVADGTGYAGTNYLALISCITDTTPHSLDELPADIGLDRCAVTTGGTVKVWDAVRLDATDSFIVGCNFYNLFGGGNDGSNAIRTYHGQRLLMRNNKFECQGAAYFTGADDDAIADDISYTRNYHIRNPTWMPETAGTNGDYGVNKSSLELKVGERVLIAENVFENQWHTSHAALMIKADATNGPISTNHVTIRGNRITGCYNGIYLGVAGTSDGTEIGPNHDFLVKDNLIADFSYTPSLQRAININVWKASSDYRLRRCQIKHNTLMNTVYLTDLVDGTTPGAYHVFTDNILSGEYGYSANGGGEGAIAFNNGWGADYVATHNLFESFATASAYDDDTSPTPLGTLTNNAFPADVAAIGFTDSDNGDYSISSGSDYATSSSTGGKPGYDSATYDPIWAGVND